MIKKEYLWYIDAIIDANSKRNKANPKHNHNVKDDFGGKVFFDGKKWKYDDSGKHQKKDKIIVLVLESPHKDEFNKKGIPIRPLNNREVIEKNIDKVLKLHLKTSDTYCIYFINAICLQCSLGFDTELFRDVVFLYYWEKYKKNFEKRFDKMVRNYRNDVELVINAVTKGTHKKLPYLFNSEKKQFDYIYTKCGKSFFADICNTNEKYDSLQSVVKESILSVLGKNGKKQIYKEGTHPSGWYSKKAIIH